MTREQVSLLGLAIAMGGVFGGWLQTLHTWGDAFTPHSISGLLTMMSAAYGGGKLMMAFDAVRALPRENPPPAISQSVQTERHIEPSGEGIERKKEITITDSKIGGTS